MLNSVTERKTFEWKSLSTLNVLPYQDANGVVLKKNSNMGEAMLLNNSLRRFVDNDLYNEQLILNIKEGRNVPGATVTGLSQVVIDSAENHKFALTSIADISEDHPYQIVIGKKKIADNDDQVSSVPFFEGEHVNFYVYDGRKWVVGTKKGLFCSADRLSDWHRVGERGDDYLIWGFENTDCRCCIRNIYQGSFKNDLDKYEFFLGTNDRVLGLNTALEFGETVTWEPVHTGLIGITPNRLYLDTKEKCLFVCSTTGLYKCTGKNCKRERKTHRYSIPSMIGLEGNDVTKANERLLIATNTGVKQSTNAYFPKSIHAVINNFLVQQRYPGDTEPLGMEVTSIGLTPDRSEVRFIGTAHGLRIRNSEHINKQTQYYAAESDNISKHYTFDIDYAGGQLYVGYRDTKGDRTNSKVYHEISPDSKTFEEVTIIASNGNTSKLGTAKEMYRLPYDCLLVTSYSYPYLYIIDTNEDPKHMYVVPGYAQDFGEPNSVSINGEDVYVASTNGIHIFRVMRNYYIRLDKKSWMYNKNILYARKSDVTNDNRGWVSVKDLLDGNYGAYITNGVLSSPTKITGIDGNRLTLVTPTSRRNYFYSTEKNGIFWSDNVVLSSNVLSCLGDRTMRRIEKLNDNSVICVTDEDTSINVSIVENLNRPELMWCDILNLGTGFGEIGRPQIKYFNENNNDCFAVFERCKDDSDPTKVRRSRLSVFSYFSYLTRKYYTTPYEDMNEWEVENDVYLGSKNNCIDVSYDRDTATATYSNQSVISGKNKINARWLRDEPNILFLPTMTNFAISASATGKAVVCPYDENGAWMPGSNVEPTDFLDNLVGLERIHLDDYSDAIVQANKNKLRVWRPALGTAYLSTIAYDILEDEKPNFLGSYDNFIYTDKGTYNIRANDIIELDTYYPDNIVTEARLKAKGSTVRMFGLSGGEFAWFATERTSYIKIDGKSVLDLSENSDMVNKLREGYVCSGIALPKVTGTMNAFGKFYRDDDNGWGGNNDWQGTYDDHRFIPFFLVGEKIGGSTLNKVFFSDGDILDWIGMSINNDSSGAEAINCLDSGTGDAIAIAAALNYVVIAAKSGDGFDVKYLQISNNLLDNDGRLKTDIVKDFNNWTTLVSSSTGTVSHLRMIEENGFLFGTFIADGKAYVIREKSDRTGLQDPLALESTPAPVSIFCQCTIAGSENEKVQFFSYTFDANGHMRIRGWEVSSNSVPSFGYRTMTERKADVPNDSDTTNRKVLALCDTFGASINFPHYIFLIVQDGNTTGKIKRTEIITRGYSFKGIPTVAGYTFEKKLLSENISGHEVTKIAATTAPENTDEANKSLQFFAMHLKDEHKVRIYRSESTNGDLEDITITPADIADYIDILDISFGFINLENEVSMGLNMLCKSAYNDTRVFIVQQIFNDVDVTAGTILTDRDMFVTQTQPLQRIGVNGLGRTPIDFPLFILTNHNSDNESVKLPLITDKEVINALPLLRWAKDFGSAKYRVMAVSFFDHLGKSYALGVDNDGGTEKKKTIVYHELVMDRDAAQLVKKDLKNTFPYDFWTFEMNPERNFLVMSNTHEGEFFLKSSNCNIDEDSSSSHTTDTVKEYAEVTAEPLSTFVVNVGWGLENGFENPVADYMFFNNKGMWRWLPKVEIKHNTSKGEEGHIAYLTDAKVQEIRKQYPEFDFNKGRYDCSYCAAWDEELKQKDKNGKNLSTLHYVFSFDFTTYAINFSFLSSDISAFCFQLPRKCEGVETMGDGNYLMNFGNQLKVIDTQTNRFINLELEDIDTKTYYRLDANKNVVATEINNVVDMYPLEMASNNSIYLVANSGLLVNLVNYHKERCFEDPMGEYKILAKRFFDKDIRSLFRITDREIIVGTHDFGTYMVRNLAICTSYLDEHGNVLKGNSECITSVLQDASKGYRTKYLFSSGDKIYNTLNTVNSNPEITHLSAGCNVNFICAENDTQYAMCTNRGLFITELHYDIDDELHRFSIESISALASDDAEILLYNHIRTYHQLNDFWVKLYKKAPASLNKVPAGFTTPEGVDLNNAVKMVFNDVVELVEFNDSNKYIKASVKNWATDQLKGESIYSRDNYIDRLEFRDKVYDLSEIPYVCKFWESGMVEIMVYVPTTLTFYMNNPRGFSNSEYSGQSINRPNIENNFNIDNSVPGRYTSLRLLINNQRFKIRTLTEIQINGNSLPLKIYKDDTYCQEGRENMFDSVIQPSLVVSMPNIVTDENDTQRNINPVYDGVGTITLEFAIYGSDAQSIRILGYR